MGGEGGKSKNKQQQISSSSLPNLNEKNNETHEGRGGTARDALAGARTRLDDGDEGAR
jgi:hypothetical protein